MEKHICDQLYAKHGSYLIGLVVAGAELGLAKQTSYNLNHANGFPVTVVTVGQRKPMVRISDLAIYLASSQGADPAGKRKKRGRPTKAETIARKMAGGGE